LLRNLEVAAATAAEKKKEYALILMAEDYIDGISLETMAASLGHLSPARRSQIMDHYLGCVCWSHALARMFFPHTVGDAVRQMREQTPMAVTP
jgi:hypothetical protein